MTNIPPINGSSDPGNDSRLVILEMGNKRDPGFFRKIRLFGENQYFIGDFPHFPNNGPVGGGRAIV